MKKTKKLVYLLFCITCVIVFAFLSACASNSAVSTDAPSGTPFASPTSDLTPTPTPFQHSSDWMADYSSILQEYRLFVDYMATAYVVNGNIFVEGEHVSSWFIRNIDYYWEYDSPVAGNVLGYALKDLNEDGIDELILLNSSYRVHAIFSTVNGKAKLLDSYRYRYECAIMESGLLNTVGSDSAGIWVQAIQRLSPDGSELLDVERYGSRYDSQSGEYYYKIENGKEVEISEAELDEFSAQYPFYEEYPNYTLTPQKITENSGIIFIPLFKEQ